MKVIGVSKDKFLSEFPDTYNIPKHASFFMEDTMGLGWIRDDDTFEIIHKRRAPKGGCKIEDGDDLKLLIALSSTDYDKAPIKAKLNATKHYTEILAEECLEADKARDVVARYEEITKQPRWCTIAIYTAIGLLLCGLIYLYCISNYYLL